MCCEWMACRVYYGLLLYMGFSQFVGQGLFKSFKLLFMDRSLYVNDVRNKVGSRIGDTCSCR